jgi:hypothetical protein
VVGFGAVGGGAIGGGAIGGGGGAAAVGGGGGGGGGGGEAALSLASRAPRASAEALAAALASEAGPAVAVPWERRGGLWA